MRSWYKSSFPWRSSSSCFTGWHFYERVVRASKSKRATLGAKAVTPKYFTFFKGVFLTFSSSISHSSIFYYCRLCVYSSGTPILFCVFNQCCLIFPFFIIAFFCLIMMMNISPLGFVCPALISSWCVTVDALVHIVQKRCNVSPCISASWMAVHILFLF